MLDDVMMASLAFISWWRRRAPRRASGIGDWYQPTSDFSDRR